MVASPASADVFVLKSGARIQGEWLNREETPVRRYVVKWEAGGQVTLDSAQVVEHIREPATVSEYERLAPQTADIAADQWRLAEWCRERELMNQRRQHLWRVIELDPNHAAARQALGFSEVEGRWVTQKEYLQERGLVYYRGKWRMPQEVDMIEAKREIERQEREWFGRIKALRGQLGTEHDDAAVRNLNAIRDPLAVKGLSDNLKREKVRRARLLYVNALANIRTGDSLALLTQTALQDADVEVFHACVDKLVAAQIPDLAKAVTDVLKDPNNVKVNRAAYILGRLDDRKAIPALAAALVTTHEVGLRSNSQTSATFVQPINSGAATDGTTQSAPGLGDSSFTAGNQAKTATVQIANQEVLSALVRLSGGQSFGFDQRAWMNWWASASRVPSLKP